MVRVKHWSPKIIPWILSLLLLMGCSHECESSFKEDASLIMRSFIEELIPVKTSADLKKRQKKIRKLYIDLSDIAINAKKWADKETRISVCDDHFYDESLNELLKKELERIYKIEGAQELMEEFQREAIERLGEFFH